MVLLEISGSNELINLDYVVIVDKKKRILYVNREGIGLVPLQLTKDEYFDFITFRDVQRYKLGR